MDLVTLCPFVASKVVWQAHSGAFALTVIVKATFVLQPGTAQLALEQDPVLDRDRFYDDDPRRSVRIPSDVVPYKPRADVMLVGHAYAPGAWTWPGRTQRLGRLSRTILEGAWQEKPTKYGSRALHGMSRDRCTHDECDR